MSLLVPSDYFRPLSRQELAGGRDCPLEVELGCGDGRFLAGMAQAHPERQFLGVERMLGRVQKTLRRISEAGLGNAQVLRLESGYTMGWLLPDASVSRVHLLCPDPWPKLKHAARRLVNQEEFLSGLERVLLPGGEFLLKTDDARYAEDAMQSLGKRAHWKAMDWPQDAFFYPTTDFEAHWLAMGRSIHRARWRWR